MVHRQDGGAVVVHIVRNSLNYVSWKLRKVVAADLRSIYTSATEQEASNEAAGVRGQVGC